VPNAFTLSSASFNFAVNSVTSSLALRQVEDFDGSFKPFAIRS